ncbi:MAG: energy-coupling factor transporter ATPase [Acutalibacteraceae bacterium]|nr:energy-coupling factor transporter ATPase [Acutalibacteraceae bacterium]
MPILEAVNLGYIYSPDTPFKHSAVNNISFSIEKNSIVGIIGHTGSGKSTLLQLLNGLLKPTSGTIKFNGKDIWEDPKKINEIRFKIGLVFQYPEYQLFEETVKLDIAFGPKNMKLSQEEIDRRVEKAAQIVSLNKNLLNKSPFDLSGGEKRRVAIAGIMAMQPEIIVFDEPTAGLDPIGRETILKAIEQYRQEFNATVIIVSHSMEDMALICDRILVLNDGDLLLDDTTSNVFKNIDMLKNIGLNVPIITTVMHKLKENSVNVPSNILNVKDAADALLSILNGGSVQ